MRHPARAAARTRAAKLIASYRAKRVVKLTARARRIVNWDVKMHANRLHAKRFVSLHVWSIAKTGMRVSLFAKLDV